MAEVNVLFWRPRACFDTVFNHVVAALTFGDYCHTEVDFAMSKDEWKEILGSFQISGKAKDRSETVWRRMEDILKHIDGSTKIHLVFYTVWGSELQLRMLTANDAYVFNRLPDPRYTASVPLGMNKEESRLALGFCFQELHKAYDARKAATFFVPRFEGVCPRNFHKLPEKYFCSEFVVYMLQQIRPVYRQYFPENITPNQLSKILEDTL
tara:strand:+ start:1487 stop:2116 length:630 start_codon:yes stop_codon:yes gene_type:complete